MKLQLALVLATVFACAVVGFAHNNEDNQSNTQRRYHTVLDNYVWSPSPEYSYQLLATQTNDKATIYILNMTSVQWLTEQEIGIRSHWFHYLEVAVPKNLDHRIKEAMVYITEGSQSDGIPTGDIMMSSIAYYTKTVCTAIHQVPNQPITFASDPKQWVRYEDAIIAFAWKHFIYNTSATEWIPRLPMVKSSVLAMDTVQHFLKRQLNLEIKKFTIAGASKRGWTGK